MKPRTASPVHSGPPAADAVERSQAIVRVAVVGLGIAYIGYEVVIGQVPAPYRTAIVVLCSVSAILSLLILAAVWRWPGVNPARRIAGMVHDYGAIALAMSFGGEALLPLYALLLWVTIGNGFRYGPRYHLAATALALLTLTAVGLTNAHARAHPYVAFMLLLTTLLVPAYAHVLLTRLHRARDEALEASQAKSRFLAQASHDLRQPIHAISLLTACLRDTPLSDAQRQMVGNIDHALDGVARLFRSLLDLSTLDSGRVAVQAEVVALDALLADVARQNGEAAERAGVTLRRVPTRAHVRADAGLLATMVQNVVSNAIKYAGGGPVLIGCRRRAGGTLEVLVLDRGPGIAAQHLPHLFDEFYRVHTPGERDVDGVGLGLSIVRRLARLTGLRVAIRSQMGRGTGVAIGGLPLAEAVPASAPAPREGAVAGLAGLAGFRVLLIEDDPLVLAATALLLAKWGCVVRQARGLPGGDLEPVAAGCDLIVTDFDLGGGLTGSECIARLRRAAGRAVPAIVMTGHDADRVRGLTHEADVFVLSKPVRPAELRSVIVAQRLRNAG